MLSEHGLIGIAWAILFLVLVCMAPGALRRRHRAEEEPACADELFLDIGGPVIDAEPA